MKTCRPYLLILMALLVMLGQLQAQVLPIKKDRKWGLIDWSGKLIASPEYDAVHEIIGDHAVVVMKGKYGLINSLGNIIVPCKYTYVRQINDKLVLLNQGGNCLEGNCEGGKWGLMSLDSRNTLEPQFDFISKFNAQGYAWANIGGKCDYTDCADGKWGVIDTLANIVLPVDYAKVQEGFGTEVYMRGPKGWGMFDLGQARMRIEPKYEYLQRINDSCVAMKEGKMMGLLSPDGDTLAPAVFEELRDGGAGYVTFAQNQRYGLLNPKGEKVCRARFDDARVLENNWRSVKLDGRWGFVDETDSLIYYPAINDFKGLGAMYVIGRQGAHYGVVSAKGKEIVPFRYQEIKIAADTLLLIQEKRQYRWIDHEGKPIRNWELEDLGYFSAAHVAKAKMLGQWGVLNWAGEWVVPARFDKVVLFEQGAQGIKGKEREFFYFDEFGRPSKVKRIMLAKDAEDLELRLNDDNAEIYASNGWFVNSRGKWGLRNMSTQKLLIEPKYTNVQSLPGFPFTAVYGKIGKSEDQAWGLVENSSGREIVEPIFERIYLEDFSDSKVARAAYRGSGKFALIGRDGKVISIENVGYIGSFKEGMAKASLGGKLNWEGFPGLDSITSMSRRDPFTREIVTVYQYCRGGKWGYINEEGTWMVQPTFEACLDFEDNIGRVKSNGKWGAINKDYKLVVEPKYDYITHLSKVGGKSLLAIGRDHSQVGFLNEQGVIVVSPSFDDAGQFSNGLVRIKMGDLWGFANLKGEIVVQPQFKEVGDFSEGMAKVRDKRKWGFIDSLGNQVTGQKYLRAGDFHDGLAWVQGEELNGYIDRNGQMAIEPSFSATGDFSKGMAPVKRKGSYGLIDTQGRWILQPKYYRIGKFHQGLAVVQEMGDFGLIDTAGNFVVKPGYREIADFSEGLAKFKNGLQYGYLDSLGGVVIGSQFANAGDFHCGRAAFFHQGKWGYIDTTGAEVIAPQYPSVLPFSEDRAAVRIGQKWGFIDPAGNLVVPMSFDRVGNFEDERAPVYREEEGWGFINPEGTVVIPCQYDAVGWASNGIYCVRQNGRWGLVNAYGAVITPCKYDQIGGFTEGLAPVTRSRSYGVVDSNGKEIANATYDNVKLLGNLIQVESDEALGYLDFAGNWVWNLQK